MKCFFLSFIDKDFKNCFLIKKFFLETKETTTKSNQILLTSLFNINKYFKIKSIINKFSQSFMLCIKNVLTCTISFSITFRKKGTDNEIKSNSANKFV